MRLSLLIMFITDLQKEIFLVFEVNKRRGVSTCKLWIQTFSGKY